MAAPDLTPYLRQQQTVRQDFAAKSTANAFSRTLAQQRGSRQIGDFNRNWQRQLPTFGSQFGQRGLSGGGIRSGVMSRAMNQFAGDYSRDLGRMRGDLADNLRQFDFNQANFVAERDAALANIQAEKAALIASTAHHIKALSPYMN